MGVRKVVADLPIFLRRVEVSQTELGKKRKKVRVEKDGKN